MLVNEATAVMPVFFLVFISMTARACTVKDEADSNS